MNARKKSLRTLNFTVGEDTYCLHPEAKLSNILDQISGRQAQLTAMLDVLTEESGAALRSLSFDTRSRFMWACQSIAQEVSCLVAHVALIVEDEDDQTEGVTT